MMKKIITISRETTSFLKRCLLVSQTKVFTLTKKTVEVISRLKEKIVLLKSQTLQKVQKIKRTVSHRYHLYCWVGLMTIVRRFKLFLQKYFGLFRRSALIALTIGIGYLVLRYSGAGYTADILSNYLITAGSMVGGTVAIVFTISIFLLQSAADLYSSQYLEVYVHDWKEKAVYFVVILISILLLGTGLYVGSLPSISEPISSYVVFSSLLLISLVFVLIDWQYKNVREKINPSVAIVFLENRGRHYLKKIHKDAKRLSRIFRTGTDEMSEDQAVATAYSTALKPFIGDFDRQLENIVQIATRLADKHELQTTKRAFSAFYHLLADFLDVRKTSSVVLPVPSTFLALQSDSRSFLVNNYERLNKAGEKFINEGKEEYASYLIQIYKYLILKAADVSFIGRSNENPILEGMESYLVMFIKSAEVNKNVEVSYQGTIVLGQIGAIATQKGYQTIVFGVQERIFDRAVFALTQLNDYQTVILGQCITNYLNIIRASFVSKKVHRKHVFDDSLKYISKISLYISALIKAGHLSNDYGTTLTLTKGFDDLHQVTADIVNYYNKVEGDSEKQSYRRAIVDYFEELARRLREVAEEAKQCDTLLAGSVGRLTSFIEEIIIDSQKWTEFQDIKKDLSDLLYRYIYIPSSFVYHTKDFDGSSNSFRSLNESVAKVGIRAVTELKDKELAKKSALSICNLAEATLEKSTNSYGYDAPRVLEKACYIAILAMKEGWEDIVEEVISKIYDFEYKYFEKHFTGIPDHIDPFDHKVWGLPHPNQLMVELTGWSHDFVSERFNRSPIHDDAKDLMLSLIDQIDIDRFTFRVWKTFSSPSPLEQELEKKHQQKRLLNVLMNIKEKYVQ